jgi:hypothetical protein
VSLRREQREEHRVADRVGHLGHQIYFHPGADIAAALAEVSAVSQTILRRMPPGTNPRSSCDTTRRASHPPAEHHSKTRSESELYDWASTISASRLAVVQGTRLPLPYGGRPARSPSTSTPGAPGQRRFPAGGERAPSMRRT